MDQKKTRRCFALLKLGMLFVIASILLGQVMTVFLMNALQNNNDNSSFFFVLFAYISLGVMLAAEILVLIALFIGVRQDRYLLAALITTVSSIIVSVVLYFLPGMSAIETVFSTINDFSMALTMIFAIFASIRLAQKQNNEEIESRGNGLLSQLAVLLLISAALNMVSNLDLGASYVPNAVIALIGASISILMYLLFFWHFKKTQKMLAP